MSARNRQKTRIIAEGMRILRLCKVPSFSSRLDPEALLTKQRNWSRRLESYLPELLNWLDEHKDALFDEGRETIKFKKSFILVYFEQMSRAEELAPFQLNDPDAEIRLSQFEYDVEDILLRQKDNSIRNMLFHYYGCRLSLQGWMFRPGEVYSFVRMCCFLTERDQYTQVRFSPKVTAFMEDFAKELLGYRVCTDHRALGVVLLNAVIPHSFQRKFETEKMEQILELALEMTRKPNELVEDILHELWNVIVHCAKRQSKPNSSLDNEIMRTLLFNLHCEEDLDTSSTYLQTLLRFLLLSVPEIEVKGFEVFVISGRMSYRKEMLAFIKKSFQDSKYKLRVSARWRFRVGQLIPKLLNRFCQTSSYMSRYYLQGLELVTWIVTYPIEKHWKRQLMQGRMILTVLHELSGMLSGCIAALNAATGTCNEILQDLRYLNDHRSA